MMICSACVYSAEGCCETHDKIQEVIATTLLYLPEEVHNGILESFDRFTHCEYFFEKNNF